MNPSDVAFCIGEAHAVCQDYALAAPIDEEGTPHTVLLSDGCSSSPHTDIGARLLAHQMRCDLPRFARQLALCPGEPPQSIADAAVTRSYRRAARLAQHLGLPGGCLDATLLGLVEISGDRSRGALYTLFYGDGVAAYGRRDGSLIVLECAYPAAYPFYPAYLASDERLERWRGVEANAQTLTRTVYAADGTVLDERRTVPDTPQFLFRMDFVDLAALTFAAVFSDGVQSFLREADGGARSPVPAGDVVRELTAFKSFTGVFAHRRLRRFAEDAAARGWSHHDDLSVAALAFGPEEKEHNRWM
jgi:hypothetical protein